MSKADLSKEVSDDELICPKHRYTYGIYYRPSRLCHHPDHKSKRRNKKIYCRSVLTRFNDFLQSKYKCNLPVGFKLCTACRNATLAAMQSSDVVEHYVEYEEEPDSELDVDYNSNYSSVSKNSFNATLSSMDEEISPIKFQLRTPVESVSAATVKS